MILTGFPLGPGLPLGPAIPGTPSVPSRPSAPKFPGSPTSPFCPNLLMMPGSPVRPECPGGPGIPKRPCRARGEHNSLAGCIQVWGCDCGFLRIQQIEEDLVQKQAKAELNSPVGQVLQPYLSDLFRLWTPEPQLHLGHQRTRPNVFYVLVSIYSGTLTYEELAIGRRPVQDLVCLPPNVS